MRLIILPILFLLLTSCAGPSSPFGADYFISNQFEISKSRSIASDNNFSIESSSAVKLFNTPYDLRINLKSSSVFDKSFRYDIIYNNRKISRWWKSENILISADKKKATIEFKNLSLMPGVKNSITFLFYPNEYAMPLRYEFQDPYCELNYNGPLSYIKEFEKGYSYSGQINTSSGLHNINAFLLASLVAQESSFNPKAVSWAKAMGLTQVTPLANQDILKIKKNWTSYPNISKMSYPTLKYKIYKGQINHKNDWRLNSNQSLEGGALFLREIISYWQKDENKMLLNKTFKNIPLTDVVLASYNSGATRVKRNIKKNNENWLWAKELKEARKYVMNIKSYCHQFKNGRP